MNKFYKKPKPETMKKNSELYKELYPKELAWCRKNVEHFKNDKFLFDMYIILITGSRKMTPKMIGAVQKAMVNPKYDPIKMIERKDKMKPILEKINRVWELVAEVDEGKNDWYLANYSALPFVNSLKKQFESNAMLSEKQMSALNSVFKKYTKRWENKEK
jgi:hypothetical protein|tara:strand:+ start:166 stop:645 length:480 start_codon:yes stop_codon:yes gene_type:complete